MPVMFWLSLSLILFVNSLLSTLRMIRRSIGGVIKAFLQDIVLAPSELSRRPTAKTAACFQKT